MTCTQCASGDLCADGKRLWQAADDSLTLYLDAGSESFREWKEMTWAERLYESHVKGVCPACRAVGEPPPAYRGGSCGRCGYRRAS